MKFHFPSIRFRPPDLVYVRRSWWKILLLGTLLAVAVSLFPSAYCALADCDERAQWCNEDCSQSCAPATGLGVLVGCSRGAYGCIEDFMSDAWQVRCRNSDDCRVSECASNPGGYGCFLSGDGRWDVGKCTAFPSCQRVGRIRNVTCCVGSVSCPTSGPSITTAALQPTPAFPLVIGQDPQRLGVTVEGITARAGEHDCSTGKITALAASIHLSSASIGWINGELARKYPGAHVKGTYPLSPEVTTTGLNSGTAVLSFRFEPLDPGDYEITVTARQDDGQTATRVFTVHVALYESTITH